MLSSLLALIERLSLFTTAAAAAAGLSLSLLGRANRKMVGKTVDQMCTMSAAMGPSLRYATLDFTEATMHLTDGVGIVNALQIVNLHQLHTNDKPLKSKITVHRTQKKKANSIQYL